MLKIATRGKVSDPPAKSSPTAVALESISTDSNFFVPCVMSRTGWVKRSLIPQEIGAICDFSDYTWLG